MISIEQIKKESAEKLKKDIKTAKEKNAVLDAVAGNKILSTLQIAGISEHVYRADYSLKIIVTEDEEAEDICKSLDDAEMLQQLDDYPNNKPDDGDVCDCTHNEPCAEETERTITHVAIHCNQPPLYAPTGQPCRRNVKREKRTFVRRNNSCDFCRLLLHTQPG